MDSFAKLCPDTLANVLFRLPEKDLIRAKCVSKFLHHFISNVCVPQLFENSPICGVHFRRVARAWESSPGRPLTMGSSCEEWTPAVMDVAFNIDLHIMGFASLTSQYEDGNDNPECSTDNLYSDLLPFEHKDGAKYFLDSCNGLLLLADRPSPFQYYVCNPATRQCVALHGPSSHLPPNLNPRAFNSPVAPSLAFDPSVSMYYKVVQFGYPNSEPRQMEMDIFSSTSGMWSHHSFDIDLPNGKFGFSKQSVFSNGVLYKLSLSQRILMVDLEGPSIDIMDAPDNTEKDGVRGCIGLSLGRLCYSKSRRDALKLWVLHEDQWILKHNVNTRELSFLIRDFGRTFWEQLWIAPCGIHPNADAVFVGTACMLLCYHFGTERLVLLYKASDSEFLSGAFHVVNPYHRCLVTLKPMGRNGGLQDAERAG